MREYRASPEGQAKTREYFRSDARKARKNARRRAAAARERTTQGFQAKRLIRCLKRLIRCLKRLIRQRTPALVRRCHGCEGEVTARKHLCESCKDKRSELRTEWRQSELGRKEQREYGRRYREANLELIRAKDRAKRRDPDKIREKTQRYRARKRGQLGNVTAGIAAKLRAAQGNKCGWCGVSFKEVTPTIDHYIPLSRGGMHDDSNLQILCLSCNSSKNDKDPIEWAQANGRLL